MNRTGIKTWILYAIAAFCYVVGAFVGWQGLEHYASTGQAVGVWLAVMIVGIGVCFSGFGYLNTGPGELKPKPVG